MKKLLLSVAVVLMASAAHAQDTTNAAETTNATPSVARLTPKVGFNLANVTNGGDKLRFGLAVGAELECMVSKMVGISTGAIYSQQGYKTDVGTEYGTAHCTLQLNYLNFPILLNAHVSKAFTIKVGVQPAFRLTGSAKAAIKNASATERIDGLRSYDVSMPIGVSYEYKNLVFDARYNYSFITLAKGADAKNSVFQVTAGYKFCLQ